MCAGVHVLEVGFRPLFCREMRLWPALGSCKSHCHHWVAAVLQRRVLQTLASWAFLPYLAICSTPELTFGLHRSPYM